MGRPLNNKYFGFRNTGSASTTSDDKIGGEGVASITLGGTNNSSGYALNDPLVISAPDLPDGVQATARVSQLGASNKILAIEVTEPGSGYLTPPTVTENVGGVQGTLTFTAVLTTSNTNAITAYAVVSSTNLPAEIKKQISTTRYKVKTSEGTAICALVTDGEANAASEMTITALDSDGGEYWVKKLTARKAVLVAKGVGGGSQFATGSAVKWTLGAAVAGDSVKLANA